jgi:hypothetical protein
MSNVLIVNRSSLEMPDAGQRAYYTNTNVIHKKKNCFIKSSFFVRHCQNMRIVSCVNGFRV